MKNLPSVPPASVPRSAVSKCGPARKSERESTNSFEKETSGKRQTTRRIGV